MKNSSVLDVGYSNGNNYVILFAEYILAIERRRLVVDEQRLAVEERRLQVEERRMYVEQQRLNGEIARFALAERRLVFIQSYLQHRDTTTQSDETVVVQELF